MNTNTGTTISPFSRSTTALADVLDSLGSLLGADAALGREALAEAGKLYTGGHFGGRAVDVARKAARAVRAIGHDDVADRHEATLDVLVGDELTPTSLTNAPGTGHLIVSGEVAGQIYTRTFVDYTRAEARSAWREAALDLALRAAEARAARTIRAREDVAAIVKLARRVEI